MMKRSGQLAALMCAAMLVQPLPVLAEAVTEAEGAALENVIATTDEDTAEVPVIKVSRTTFNGENGYTSSYFYKENGLFDHIENSLYGETWTFEYEFDDHGNPTRISGIEDYVKEDSGLELKIDTVYEGEDPVEVTCHLFSEDGNEITEPENGLTYRYSNIYVLENALASFTGYENCTVTFAGFPDCTFEKKNGRVVRFSEKGDEGQVDKAEYDEEGYITRAETDGADEDATIQSYTYDEMGKLTSYVEKKGDTESEVTFEYTEGKDEEGQTTYTSEEGLIYTVDENGVIRRKEDTFNVDNTYETKQVRVYDEQGRRIRLESYGDPDQEEPQAVVENEYY